MEAERKCVRENSVLTGNKSWPSDGPRDPHWTQNLMVETRGQCNCTLHVDINCILPKRMSHVCRFSPRVISLSRPFLRCPHQRQSPTRLLCTILCSTNHISTRHPSLFERKFWVCRRKLDEGLRA